jgi:hypothetical protein
MALENCNGPNYLQCFDKYWAWTRTDAYKAQMTSIVSKDDFLTDNYLSTDLRIPLPLLQTNACSPLATNAIAGNIWDNFSSDSYKSLPSVGKIKLRDAWTGQEYDYPREADRTLPGGGRGFTRPASLISVWSSAPYLLNNTVGELDPEHKGAIYTPPPSVEARMRAFNDGIEKMLWPEKREKDPLFTANVPGVGIIDRTTTTSAIRVPVGFIPDNLKGLIDISSRFLPGVFRQDHVEIGPIPKGMPVSLLASLDMLGDAAATPGERLQRQQRVAALLIKAKRDLRALGKDATDEQARATFSNLVPDLLALSKCPDFVVNKGHYFGTEYLNMAPFPAAVREPGLSDDDKRALIAFLKTF